jgi:hypothetical protein
LTYVSLIVMTLFECIIINKRPHLYVHLWYLSKHLNNFELQTPGCHKQNFNHILMVACIRFWIFYIYHLHQYQCNYIHIRKKKYFRDEIINFFLFIDNSSETLKILNCTQDDKSKIRFSIWIFQKKNIYKVLLPHSH